MMIINYMQRYSYVIMMNIDKHTVSLEVERSVWVCTALHPQHAGTEQYFYTARNVVNHPIKTGEGAIFLLILFKDIMHFSFSPMTHSYCTPGYVWVDESCLQCANVVLTSQYSLKHESSCTMPSRILYCCQWKWGVSFLFALHVH